MKLQKKCLVGKRRLLSKISANMIDMTKSCRICRAPCPAFIIAMLKICPGHPKNLSKPKPFTCWPFRPSEMTGFSQCGHICMPEETKIRACLHPRVQDCHQKNMNPKGLYKDHSTSHLKEGYPGVHVSSGERLAWAESCRNRNSRGKVEIEKEPEKAKYSPRRSLFQQNLFHPSQTGLRFQLVIGKKFLQSL